MRMTPTACALLLALICSVQLGEKEAGRAERKQVALLLHRHCHPRVSAVTVADICQGRFQ
uniref:Uncharacterized protein n=1 Tax=Pan paniscus TaxID=9597 RepID=A0A2R8ZC52_PANPA